jgi:hypothetical protein
MGRPSSLCPRYISLIQTGTRHPTVNILQGAPTQCGDGMYYVKGQRCGSGMIFSPDPSFLVLPDPDPTLPFKPGPLK